LFAFLSVWIALGCLVLSLTMLVYRPAFNDVTVLINLWFGCPGAVCLAGIVLWALRKEPPDPLVSAARLQAKVAIGLAVAAAAIVYGLVMAAERIPLR
jgi:hypothetical protein